MKAESHFISDQIHVAPDLRRQTRREQTMGHQPPLRVRNMVVLAVISGHPRKQTNIFLRKRPLP